MVSVDQGAQLYRRYIPNPLTNAAFRLDSLAVAGFFGGDISVNAMATVIFFQRYGWGGLYNTPGSLNIARRYGQLASTPRIYQGLFPGDTRDPSRLFGLDGKPGPKFLSPHSGSLFEQIGHLGYLIALLAKSIPPSQSDPELPTITQRRTTPGTVIIVDLNHLAPSKPELLIHPTRGYRTYGLFALIPTIVSFCTCIACGTVGDWWCFSSILLGMIANGCACYVLGLGRVAFQQPKPVDDTHCSGGILWAANNAVVVIRGKTRAVNTITRGRFFLDYRESPPMQHATSPSQKHAPSNATDATHATRDIPLSEKVSSSTVTPPADGGGTSEAEECDKPEIDGAPEGGKPNSLWIGISSIILIAQFLTQLLLVPQATFFGQLMFVCTLVVSWGYNVFISSIDREDIQIQILRNILELNDDTKEGGGNTSRRVGALPKKIRKFEFGTRTAMATFACLALRLDPGSPLANASKILDALLPNDTEEWKDWKDEVNKAWGSRALGELKDPDQGASRLTLRKAIISDARVAFDAYRRAFPIQVRAD